MIAWIEPGSTQPFPPSSSALHDPNGLLAAGGDFSPERLLAAYQRGIFPWYDESQPILWWTPDPRMVLYPDRLHVSRSLRKALRVGTYRVTADTAFADVMRHCAAPRPNQNGTWITPELTQGFAQMHELGFAHSVEIWEEQSLIGGIYGLAIGRVFFGESMFSGRRNGSKFALFHLCQHLRNHDFALIDCQVSSPHLETLGGEEVSRATFEQQLEVHTGRPDLRGSWTQYFSAQ